jgi:hypothetical protein
VITFCHSACARIESSAPSQCRTPLVCPPEPRPQPPAADPRSHDTATERQKRVLQSICRTSTTSSPCRPRRRLGFDQRGGLVLGVELLGPPENGLHDREEDAIRAVAAIEFGGHPAS